MQNNHRNRRLGVGDNSPREKASVSELVGCGLGGWKGWRGLRVFSLQPLCQEISGAPAPLPSPPHPHPRGEQAPAAEAASRSPEVLFREGEARRRAIAISPPSAELGFALELRSQFGGLSRRRRRGLRASQVAA